MQIKQINIKEYFKQEIEKLRADRSIVPSLMVIDATTQDPANQIYIRNKLKDFEALDWKAEVFRVSTTNELKKLLGGVQKHGFNSVIVQMPVMPNIEFSYDMSGRRWFKSNKSYEKLFIVSETSAKIMKFSEDFDKYARDILHINNPFKDWFKRLEKTFSETENETIIADTKELEKIDKETRVSREEWIKLRDRYVAERISRELGYEVLSISSYFKHYPDVIPCEGASGQCTIECRMRGCKYE